MAPTEQGIPYSTYHSRELCGGISRGRRLLRAMLPQERAAAAGERVGVGAVDGVDERREHGDGRLVAQVVLLLTSGVARETHDGDLVEGHGRISAGVWKD